MNALFHRLCSKRSKSQKSDHLKKNDDPQLWRDVLAYWILGLTSEFGYVVIISAAHDILQGFEHGNDNDNQEKPYEIHSTADGVNNMRQSVCNIPSAGVLLIADIVPSIIMNISCPFLPLAKNIRMFIVIVLNVTSYMLISSTEEKYLAIIGVICTSLGLGLAEVTLLSYSARFNKKVLTAWSSGTGSAGIIASSSWAGLLAIGLSLRDTIRIFLIVPAIQATTFWFLLRSPNQQTNGKMENETTNIATIESINSPGPSTCNQYSYSDEKLSGVMAKLKFVPKLSGFIIPLVIVFIFEYICVSGLFEMLHVRDAWLPPETQYRWFLVVYQIGVFTARSLGSLVKPCRTWWATFVQFINVCCFIYMAATMNVPKAWVILILVFGVGIVGGMCYIHTFHRLVRELPSNKHKFSLGMIIIAESIGIAIGGFIGILIHNIICGRAIIS